MAILLWAGFAIAQQPVVQVPANCNVVVAGSGTGAVTGMGGKVGNGGVVLMPDPGNGSFTIISNGASLSSWILWGDISFSDPFIPFPIIDQSKTATTTPVTIFSYNKKKRDSETIDFARSKGQVWVTYTNGGCGGRIEFDIYKQYDDSNVPPIIGPDCWLPNRDYTYSVDQIASDNLGDEIGVDEYYWTVSNGTESISNIYTSADKSSITFKTPDSLSGNWQVKVCYGRGNGWDGNAGGTHTTCVTKTVGKTPLAPSFSPEGLDISTPFCLPTGTTSYVVNVVSPDPGFTYQWTSSNPTWDLAHTGTPLGSTLTISNLDNNPGVLTLKITNGTCEPQVFTYEINRSFAPELGITGKNGATPVTCIDAATEYSLPQNALGNTTNWTISPVVAGGPTVVAGPGSGSTCTVTPGTASGQFTLTATSANCIGTSTSLVFNVKPATPVFTATTPTCVIKGTNLLTTIAVDTSVPGTPTTGYTWNLSEAPGWTINAGGNTSNPTFRPNGTTAGPVTLKVSVTVNGCVSQLASIQISYLSIATYPSTAGYDQYVLANCSGNTAQWYINESPLVEIPGVAFAYGDILLLGGSGPAPTSVCAQVDVNGTTQTVCATTLGTHSANKTSGNTEDSFDNSMVQDVKLFPNPNNGEFVIRVSSLKNNGTATILDSSGKKIKSQTLKEGDNNILMQKIPQGNYIVVLEIDGKSEARKIVIK